MAGLYGTAVGGGDMGENKMSSEYDSLVINNLNKSELYKQLKGKCCDKYPEILTLVNAVAEYSVNKSKTIIRHMKEFTLHDETHSFHMLFIIEKLIPNSTLIKLSVPDIMLIILSVFLHDIGMCPEESILLTWKNQINEKEAQYSVEEAAQFKRYRLTFTQELEEISQCHIMGFPEKACLLEDYIITNYIRTTHADRARKMIACDWAGRIKFLDADLTNELADICFSHNESYKFLFNLDTLKPCGTDTFVCLPFIAVLLRIADIMDFDPKRTPQVLFDHLAVKNPVSLQEWRKHQSINAWTIQGNTLIYTAQCEHPAIEAAIKEFCYMVEEELRNGSIILSNLYCTYGEELLEKYKIHLPTQVDTGKVGPIKDIITGKPIYKYHNTKFTLSKKQIIDLMMGTKLYGSPDVALRELIQNSIDTCVLREKLSNAWGDSYKPQITISFYTEGGNDYLSVCDNGMGMDQHIVDNFYTNVGCSYYKSKEFYELLAQTESSFKPISRFGIGILAYFMVCDNLIVETRHVKGPYQFDDALRISIEGYDSLFIITDSSKKVPGTDTILKLRKGHPWATMSCERFFKSVREMIPKPSIPIKLIYKGEEEDLTDIEFFNLDLQGIKDYSWDQESDVEKENIKVVEIDLTDPAFDFQGMASIAYIVKNKAPCESLEILSKEIEIDYEKYELSCEMKYGRDNIEVRASGLEVREDGGIDSNSTTRHIFRSNSALSIHGIEVPCKLFYDYFERNQSAVLHLPFPVVFRLNIGENYDLNLNSARTQIIYDEVWQKFEKDLFQLMCCRLKDRVGVKEWELLKSIFITRVEDREMKNVIDNI